MFKVGLEIKNGSKALKPKKGDVIIFDGKEWYVTTKDDIFREYQEKMDEKLAEIERELVELRQFKREVSEQIIEMSEIVKGFVKLQGDK